MWGKEPNSEAAWWLGSLQGWAQGTPHFRGSPVGPVCCSWGPRPLWHPPKPASLRARLLQLRPALWAHKASSGTHIHTRVCFMVAGAPGEGHSLGTRQEAANGVLPAEG